MSWLRKGLPLAFAFVLVWVILHPQRPHMATSDLYTHLGVARHIVQGEGFLCDVVYPLSITFPFGARTPQPLLHRQPGFPLLLTIPYLLAGKDPTRTLNMVVLMQIGLLGAIVWLGSNALLRRRRGAAIAPWLLLLMVSPLLKYNVVWGQIETACGLVILALWLKLRDKATRPGRDLPAWLGIGLLAGALNLLRMDLFWIPALWLLASWCRRPANQVAEVGTAAMGGTSGTDGTSDTDSTPAFRPVRISLSTVVLAAMVWILLMTPWGIHNWRVTGNPFFKLQSYSEHVKMTSLWPGYSVYRSLSPEPFFETLRDNPRPVMLKLRSGIRFFLVNLRRWQPWPFLVTCGLLVAVQLRRRRLSFCWSPLVMLVTLGLMCLQYSLFDHDLRHLVPLLPVFTWEFCLLAADNLAEWRRRTRWSRAPASANGWVLFIFVALCIRVAPQRLPGWDLAARGAAEDAYFVRHLAKCSASLPPGPVFTDNAAVLWFNDRAGVWMPLTPEVEQEVRERIPDMAEAPWIRLWPPAP